MKKIFTLLTCSLLAVTAMANTKDYMLTFSTDEGEKSICVRDVRKITFDENGGRAIGVYTRTGGQSWIVDYNGQNMFNIEYTDGIEQIIQDEAAISIALIGNTLQVESNEQLQRVVIYNMNGMLVKSLSAEGNSLQEPVDELPDGIYIVQVTTESGETVKKLAKS